MSVEERLAALEAKRAILYTLHAYGHAIDYGDERAFRDCWMPDALLTYSFDIANARGSGEPRDAMRFEGRDAIAGFFRAHTTLRTATTSTSWRRPRSWSTGTARPSSATRTP